MKKCVAWCFLLCYYVTAISQDIKIIPQTGHLSDVTAFAFNSDNSVIATGDNDGNIILWDFTSRQQIKKFSRHSNGIHKLSFSPNGKYLVSGGYDKLTLLWNIETGLSRIITTNLYYVNDVVFHPSGEYIFSTSADFTLTIYNVNDSSKKIVKHHTDLTSMAINDEGSEIYVGDYKGNVYKMKFGTTNSHELIKLYDAESYVNALAFDSKSNTLAISSTRRFDVNNSENYDGTLEFWDLTNNKIKKPKYRAEGAQGCNNYMLKSVGSGEFVYVNQEELLFRVSAIKEKSEAIVLPNTPQKFNYLEISDDVNYFVVPVKNEFTVVDLSNPRITYEFNGTCTGVIDVLNYSDSKLTIQYDNGVSQWDLTTGRLKALNNANYTNNHTSKHVIVSDDQRFEIIEDQRYGFSELAKTHQRSNMGVVLGNGPKVVTVKFSPNNEFLAVIDVERNLYIYQLGSLKVIFSHKVSESRIPSPNDYKLVFSPDEKQLVVLSDYLLVINLTDFEESWKFDIDRKGNHSLLTAAFSSGSNFLMVAEHSLDEYYELPENSSDYDVTVIPAGMIREDTTYLAARPGKISFFNCEETKFLKSLSLKRNESGMYADVSAGFIAKNSSIIQLGLTDGRLLSVDLATGDFQEKQIGSWEILDIRPLNENSKALIVTDRAGVYLYDPTENKIFATLLAMQSGGYSVISSNGYYLRSKNGYNGMAIKKDEQIFKAEQFDVHLNRPDLVLSEIGLSKSKLVTLYKSAYQKQLLYSEKSMDVDLPTIGILNKSKIDYVVQKPSIKLKLEAFSNKKIRALQVWVNGAPTIYGSGGYEIKTPVQQIGKKVTVPLKYGENVIEVASQNVNGVWSLKETIKVKCDVQSENRKMLIVAVSISDYLDTNYNLKYSVKDGKEFSEIYVNDGRKTLGYPGHFDEVEVIQLFNEQATRENILALRSQITQLTSNDVVLFYVSGHGLLDEDKNFWYATYDINFSQPEKRGVSFEQLEKLLDDIPVQNKAMFLDACHSGLSDTRGKTEKVKYVDESSNVTSYGSRGGKTRINGITSNLAYQTMQDLFNNLNRGSGTVVISASAGNSYAFESDEWENGVFTYCLINGLKNRMADTDKNGEITINELSRYVSLEVDKLTRGGQKPNERQENLYNNFRLW